MPHLLLSGTPFLCSTPHCIKGDGFTNDGECINGQWDSNKVGNALDFASNVGE
jgi:hypothetical protein